MHTHMILNGIRYSIGDLLVSNGRRSSFSGYTFPEENIFTIKVFKGKDEHIGIVSNKEIASWHTLDGITKENYGYWINKEELMECFIDKGVKSLIKSDFYYKKLNLKEKACKVLKQSNSGNTYLVEMEDDIGGGSGDGCGKAGHCIIIPAALLKRSTQQTADKE